MTPTTKSPPSRNGSPRLEIRSEPLTYGRHARHSFYRDLIAAERGDGPASARQRRHVSEMRVELPRLERDLGDGFEQRVNPSRLQGHGGYLAPPIWLQPLFAKFPRAVRAVADTVPSFPLPAGAQSVNLPRLVGGTATAVEQDLGVDQDVDLLDAAVSSSVVTISGHEDVALQNLEQSPADASFDWAVTQDLESSYNQQLETQILNGTGGTGQLLGLLNTVGNSVTYTAATPTAPGIYPSLGALIAKTAQARGTAAGGYFVLSSSRGAWLGSSEDTATRPLDLDNAAPNGQFDILSYRTLKSDAMPRTVNGAQEPVVFFRPADCVLWESDAHTGVALDVLSGTLQARITYRRYAAWICRYPAGVSVLTGSGTVPVSPF